MLGQCRNLRLCGAQLLLLLYAACDVYEQDLLHARKGTSERNTGTRTSDSGLPEHAMDAAAPEQAWDDSEPWWASMRDGCRTAGLPTLAERPAPQSESVSALPPIYLGWTALHFGSTASARPLGLDLDGVCTNDVGGCAARRDQMSCKPLEAVPYDGPGCRDNRFGSALALLAQSPEVGARFGLTEAVVSCELARGSYNMIARISDYNGTAEDDSVRVDYYSSLGLEQLPRWDCQTDRQGAPNAWSREAAWRVDARDLAEPLPPSASGWPDAQKNDTQAYVHQGYLVSHIPDGTALRLRGEDTTQRGLQLEVEQSLWIGRLLQEADGAWQIQDGLIAGRTRIGEALRSLHLTGFCRGQGVDAAYEPVESYIRQYADVLASGESDSKRPCDALSFGIGFEAAQVTPGAVAMPSEPAVECCAPGTPLRDCKVAKDRTASAPQLAAAADSGTASLGCAGSAGTAQCPLRLRALSVSPGTLVPAFDPAVAEYNVLVPVLSQQVELAAEVDADVQLAINDQPIQAGSRWTSALLGLGDTPVPIRLKAGASSTDYRVVVQRGAAARQVYAKANVRRAGDLFGVRLAVYGETVVVGVPHEAGGATSADGSAAPQPNAGAVYIFKLEGEQLRQEAYLKSDEISADDMFGAGVAVWKNRLAVGALGQNVFNALGTATNDGRVYIYEKIDGSWQRQESIIVSADAKRSGDAFGFALALKDDQLVVGAPLEDDGAVRSGAAYLFDWDGRTWQQTRRFKAPMPQAESRFGSTLAFDGNTVVIAGSQEDVGSLMRAGAVYAYTRVNGEWPLAQRLIAPAPRAMAQFGFALAVRGDTLIVTAPHNPLEFTSDSSGEAHVYKRAGAEFMPVARVEANEPLVGDYFGQSVAISANALVIGASEEGAREGDTLTRSGTMYLYARTEQSLVATGQLRASNADVGDAFGYAVGLSDELLAVSAPNEASASGAPEDNSARQSGAVYVMR